MIRTLTPAECAALTVRGDVPGILDGYCGPVVWGERTARIALGRAHEGYALIVGERTDDEARWAPAAELHLPLARPEVHAHLVGWLGRGWRGNWPDGQCYVIIGAKSRLEIGWTHGDDGRAGVLTEEPADTGFRAVAREECGFCQLYPAPRPRYNLYSLLLPAAHGGLPDEWRAALLAGSVERVAAGMGPLDWVLSERQQRPAAFGRPRQTVRYRIGQSERPAVRVDYRGWFVGPEDGDVGNLGGNCDKADLAALAQGFALIDQSPAGRVIRFEVPNG